MRTGDRRRRARGAAVFVRTGRLKRPWEWAVDKAVKGKVFKVT